jgi:hypothetical protein
MLRLYGRYSTSIFGRFFLSSRFSPRTHGQHTDTDPASEGPTAVRRKNFIYANAKGPTDGQFTSDPHGVAGVEISELAAILTADFNGVLIMRVIRLWHKAQNLASVTVSDDLLAARTVVVAMIDAMHLKQEMTQFFWGAG